MLKPLTFLFLTTCSTVAFAATFADAQSVNNTGKVARLKLAQE